MNPRPPRSRDWRAQPPIRSAYSREWRGAGTGGGTRISKKFKLGIFGFFLVVLLLVAGFLIYDPIFHRVLPAQLLTFGIGAYGEQTNLLGIVPVNPFGKQDADAFEQLHILNPTQFPEIPTSTNYLNSKLFLKFCRDQYPRVKGKNLIVFCTMHGIVQPSGEVRLFVIDNTPENPEEMIRFKDFIDQVKDSPAQHVLVVIDAARLNSSWKLGVLSNDVAEQIQCDFSADDLNRSDEKRITNDKVAILLAAGPGQQSWPKLGQSALAHFLIEGLKGAADGWEDKNGQLQDSGHRNRRIMLHELTAYTRQQIEDWSQRRYGIKQSVQLVGKVRDYDLAAVNTPNSLVQAIPSLGTGKKAPASPEPDNNEAAKTTNESNDLKPAGETSWNDERANALWIIRDQCREDNGEKSPPVRRQAPLAWRRFEATLALAEELKRGGQEKPASDALQQADEEWKKLNDQITLQAGMNWTPEESQLLKEWGFTLEVITSTRESDAEAEKAYKELLADPPPNPPKSMSTSLRKLLTQHLNQTMTEKDLSELKMIVSRLVTTPDVLFLRSFLYSKSSSDQFEPQDLENFFNLWDRFRNLARRTPESWPRVKDQIRSGLRSIEAAERWILATDIRSSEAREWLQKAQDKIDQAENIASLYSNAIGIWSDLLVELPTVSEWVATRASDDNRSNQNWNWWGQQARREGHLTVADLRNRWPEKPKEVVDVERKLLNLYEHAQLLKNALFAPIDSSTDDLLQIVTAAEKDRGDFWKEMERNIRPTEVESPPPAILRDAHRLLAQPWLSAGERRSLDKLKEKFDSLAGVPKERISDSLPDRSTTFAGVWQGFWAIMTLDLFALTPNKNETLWKDWGDLVELSQQPVGTIELSASDKSKLRIKRAALGQGIRGRWADLLPMDRNPDLPTIHLQAALRQPFRTLLKNSDDDSDYLLRKERQLQFREWLNLFSEFLRNHSVDPGHREFDSQREFEKLAGIADGLTLAAANHRDRSTAKRRPYPRVKEDPSRFSFNTDRQFPLELSFATPLDEEPPTHVMISGKGTGVRLLQEGRPSRLDEFKILPIENGKAIANLGLEKSILSPQTLLVVSTEADRYPLEFRQVLLNPPFNASEWRIELSDAKDPKKIFLTSPLPETAGATIFLAPISSVMVKANLIRPINDVTPSADVAVYCWDDSNKQKQKLGECKLTLTPGVDRIPIKFELPAAGTAVAPTSKVLDLARGIVFEIAPEGQENKLTYEIRPEFYSETNFINNPKPLIQNNRLILEVRQKEIQRNDDWLLPKEWWVKLNVPSFLKNGKNATFIGDVRKNSAIELGFDLPANWKELASSDRGKPFNIALDVAGLPHAYAWTIDQTGVRPRKEPHISISLAESEDVKNPRRKPIVIKGKDSLKFRFQVTSKALSDGEWRLDYRVYRVENGEFSSTPIAPLGGILPLSSSLERHVFLKAVKDGVWEIDTDVADYFREVPKDVLEGQSVNRLRVQADLLKANDPTKFATAEFEFAIADDTKPKVTTDLLPESKILIDRDLVVNINAIDRESGIERIRSGFDKDFDGVLQDAELLATPKPVPTNADAYYLDEIEVARTITISQADLQFAKEKDSEKRHLLIEVRNGLGITNTESVPIKLQRPAIPTIPTSPPSAAEKTKPGPPKEKKGTLVIKLTNLPKRYREATIKISGTEESEKKLEDGRDELIRFEKLKPGPYTIEVNVTISISEARFGKGKKDVEVKPDNPEEKLKTVEVEIIDKK